MAIMFELLVLLLATYFVGFALGWMVLARGAQDGED